MTSREFLESVREAALDARLAQRQLATLDAMKATPMTARRRQDLTARIERDESIVSEAEKLLHRYAEACGDERSSDLLWWRYCRAEDWRHTARAVDYSISQARLLAGRALDGIDAANLL